MRRQQRRQTPPRIKRHHLDFPTPPPLRLRYPLPRIMKTRTNRTKIHPNPWSHPKRRQRKRSKRLKRINRPRRRTYLPRKLKEKQKPVTLQRKITRLQKIRHQQSQNLLETKRLKTQRKRKKKRQKMNKRIRRNQASLMPMRRSLLSTLPLKPLVPHLAPAVVLQPTILRRNILRNIQRQILACKCTQGATLCSLPITSSLWDNQG
mmetsp:Transcript_16691/g.34253  ORF Transcript_16691/g.34253 Transcript_16691/m.34253 type:complete len:206 (+) Transcript_16691:1030-1647(+)